MGKKYKDRLRVLSSAVAIPVVKPFKTHYSLIQQFYRFGFRVGPDAADFPICPQGRVLLPPLVKRMS